MKRALSVLVWAALFGCAGAPPAPRYSGAEDAYATLIERSEIPAAADQDVLALPAEAEAMLSEALAGEGIVWNNEPREGNIGLFAGIDGLLKVDSASLAAFNMMDEVMCATLHSNTLVKKGELVVHTYLPSRPGKATWYFVLAYWIVTLLGILLTVVFAAIYKPPSPQELGVPFSQAPAYLMTLPYHPLLNLLWLPFAWLYLKSIPAGDRKSESFKLGMFWVVICILIDLAGWILIPHPWAMTFREFYIDYQPWITLIYLVIFASPIAAYALQKAFPRRNPPLRVTQAAGKIK